MRRYVQPLVLLVGALVLGFWLYEFEGVFEAERRQAEEDRTIQRRTLETYSRSLLLEQLEARRHEAEQRIDAALKNPLLPDENLLLVESGNQLLPRLHRFGESNAKDIYDALRTKQIIETTPWGERVRLFERWSTALERKNLARVEALFRQILAHRTRHLLPPDRELPFMVLLLERFVAESQPDAALMMALLREGLSDQGSALMGLQPLLLEHRGALSSEDFTFLYDRIVRLSEQSRVPTMDFAKQAALPERLPLDLVGVAEKTIVGQYFVVPRGSTLSGVRLNLKGSLRRVTRQLIDARLLFPGDRLSIPPADRIPIGALHIIVQSERWVAAAEANRTRYRLKTGLAIMCFFLALGLVTMALLLQHRRRQLLESKSSFVSTVSHELKTPLAAMRVLAETLERRLKEEPKVRDYPTRIVREIDGMTFLVENILSFNRLEKGRFQIRPRPIRLRELIETMTDEILFLSNKPVAVDAADVEEVTIEADVELMKLLFINLAKNAVQYSRKEGVKISVETQQEKDLVVRFSDDGIGMPQSAWKQVFVEFHRHTPADQGRTQGSGLGLAICRRVMLEHGGDIYVESSSDSGTTFEMRFPHAG